MAAGGSATPNLLQEYAGHLGHLDIVTELATGLSEE